MKLLTIESADAAEEALPQGFALDMTLHNKQSLSAESEIHVRLVTEHEARTIALAGPSIPPNSTVQMQLPEGSFGLAQHPQRFSGQIRLDAEVTYSDGSRAQSNAIFRSFHFEAGVWHSYDNDTLVRLYQGGALTKEARLTANQMLRSSSSRDALIGFARGTKISDDPTYVPTEGGDHE